MKKILVVCPYPKGKAAGQRFKYEQYFNSWEKEGYFVEVSSFFDNSTWEILYEDSNFIKKAFGTIRGYFRRARDLISLSNYDIVYIHMWVTPLGPPLFEILFRFIGKKIVYDFDDSVFLASENPKSINLSLSRSLKSRYLIKHANHVILSSPFNIKYCSQKNLYSSATYIPCSINTDRFIEKKQVKDLNEKIVLGWTGTFSSIPYLNLLREALISLRKEIDFKLLLITNFEYSFDEIDLEVIRWNEETEVEDLHRIDIGLYPLSEDKWSLGKGGLKVMQYMSIGIPSVSTDFGTAQNIIKQGENGFLVKTKQEWIKSLKDLIEDNNLRYRIGSSARRNVLANYSNSAVEKYYLRVLDQM